MTAEPDAPAPDAVEEPELARAAALLEIGRARDALRELGRLPAHLADDRRTFRLRVQALVDLEQWDNAAGVAQSGLSTCPDGRLLGQLGLARQALGDYSGAERALLDGLAIEPSDVVLLCRYALLCGSAGQLAKARRLLALGAQVGHETATVYVTRVLLAYAAGRDRQAERIASEFVGQLPDATIALDLYARATALRGKTVTAYSSLARAVAKDPSDEERARLALELRVRTHPLLQPLRPMERLGAVFWWLVTVLGYVLLWAAGLRALAVLFVFVSFTYIAYSWTAPLLVRHLTSADRPQATVEAGAPAPPARRPGWLRWTIAVTVALMALCCGGFAGVDIGPAVRAATGSGTPGTIVLTRKDCDARTCSWYGDFTSDDRSLVWRDASMHEALSEALVLAERAGVDREAAYRVFAASAVAAPYVRYKRDAFEHPDGTPVA